ncbi:TonB family protein [Burkholderia cepacia]|uniref:TonB family protein n=1 Tax=Burkholderia cepacia TaxID=292 RepID=A0AAX2RXY7_BURCE|nr:energy transducer TonB [Burkholderia cepacia]TES81313.1 TonB family protein [Burkholderia cepacia]TES99259.1 TonB family protein [Burkholderia cepacia]TEU37095.1 TonB family protein [Burkholderia cepacia]TEU48467.1 TonB family protein [Burkholderia cepacia]TEU52552.1 TonB family protein [Burkholderia cepacia]
MWSGLRLLTRHGGGGVNRARQRDGSRIDRYVFLFMSAMWRACTRMGERGKAGAMNTAAFGARQATGVRGAAGDRVRRRGTCVASVFAAVCVLHAALFVLLAHEQIVRREPLQRQVIVATLIAAAPEMSTTAAAKAKPVAASHAVQEATSAPRSSAGSGLRTNRQVASGRPRPPAHDAPVPAPAQSGPSLPAAAQRDTPHDDAAARMPTQTQTQPESRSSSVSAPPRFVAHPDCALVKPDYPPQSLRLGEHGTVLVELETDAAGQIVAARVVTGSGYPRLDAAAREAVLASRCAPHVFDGAPVPTRARAPIAFNLDD